MKRYGFTLAAVAIAMLVTAQSVAQVDPAEAAAKLREAEVKANDPAALSVEVDRLRKENAQLKKRVKELSEQVDSQAETIQRYKAQDAQVAKDAAAKKEGINVFTMQLDDFGQLRLGTFQTHGVINGRVTTWPYTVLLIVVDVVDEDTLLVQASSLDRRAGNRTGKLFFLDGVSTRGLVTDAEIEDLPGDFKVTGTRSYEAVDGGERTVFVVTRTEPKPD